MNTLMCAGNIINYKETYISLVRGIFNLSPKNKLTMPPQSETCAIANYVIRVSDLLGSKRDQD